MTGERIVLLIEDDPNDQVLVMRAHRLWGQHSLLLMATSGTDALTFLSDEDILARIAVVLLDLKIGAVNGFDVLKVARRLPSSSHIPIVVFSSSAEPEDVSKAYELGASGYVQKPIAFDEHQQSLRDIFDFWLRTERVADPFGEFVTSAAWVA